MLDRDIRAYLYTTYLKKYEEDKDSWVVPEMGLCDHTARIDIGVINGQLVGYEIKSDRDTLTRLPNQLKIYNQVFDSITIVCGPKHLGKLQSFLELQPHVGLLVTQHLHGKWDLVTVREPSQNPNRSSMMIASLLWHEEAKALLVDQGLGKGLSRLRRWELWERLAEHFTDPDEMSSHVRRILKARSTWREA